MSQTKSGCNTIPRGKYKKKYHRNRGRNWSFTLNNYVPENLTQISHKMWGSNEVMEGIIQEEIGEEKGTEHLQGAICFKNQVDFTTLKKLWPAAHWEKSKGKIASLKYCGKLDTRNGKTITIGPVEKYVQKRKLMDHEISKLMQNDRPKLTEDQLAKLELMNLFKEECIEDDP